MNYFKITQSDEKLDITIPAKHAIEALNNLQKAAMLELDARPYLDLETLIQIFLKKKGLFSIQHIVSQPETPEDEIDYQNTDGAIDTIKETRNQLITIGFVLSLLRRKVVEQPVEEDPFADLLPEMPSAVVKAGPLAFAMDHGTATPAGASPSDPLTEVEAINLYNLVKAAEECISEGREKIGAPTLDMGSISELLRNRSIFLLRLRGHHFRERFPLGHNCCPRSPKLDYLMPLTELYVELIKKNISPFFRYPILYNKFYQLFKEHLIKLAKQKKRGQVPANQKISILDIWVRTGEEPISLMLTAARCLENQRKKLTKILGSDPGKISDWIQIIALEKQVRYAEDIQAFLAAGYYPNSLKDEIPLEQLSFARKHGFIIEGEEHFSFSPEIMDSIEVTFLNLFDLDSLKSELFSQKYDFVFYIKVLEYLITDPRNTTESISSQTFLDLFDSGELLKPTGYLCTDGDKLRSGWTEMSKEMSMTGMVQAAMRRLPGGEALEQILGPKTTSSNSALDIMEHGEMSIPLSAQPLNRRTFAKVALGYPMDEVQIGRFTGKIKTPADDLRQSIAKLKKRKKALNKALGQGRYTHRGKQTAQLELSQIESDLVQTRRDLRKLLKGGTK